MAKWGNCDFRELKKFQQELEKISKANISKFCEDVSKELAARLLRKVIKRTPVGLYSGETYTCVGGKTHKGSKKKGMVGGTLRRGWTAKTEREAMYNTVFEGNSNISKWINELPIKKNGNTFQVDVTNVVSYASYVEHGHRTRNHKGWVEGHFMLTISEKEINAMLPKFIEKKLTDLLSEVF